jgi:hypothetical protein
MGKLAGIRKITSARKLVARGWTVKYIARIYGVAVPEVLAILPSKPIDPWKGTWYYKESAGVELPAAAEISAGQVNPPSAMASPADPIEPFPSTWCGPSSPCATSLQGGRRRIKD